MMNPHRRQTFWGAAFLAVLLPFLKASSLAQAKPSEEPAPELALSGLAKSEGPIPFKAVIRSTTGHQVLALDTNDVSHRELLNKLRRAASLAGERARREGIVAARANEAGNYMERFVRDALKEAGLNARIPQNTDGRSQSTGYPDLEITSPVPCYVELKTYNASTFNTTQRSFYYSPSASPKVTRDAVHLLLAYELEKVDRDGRSLFVPKHWKVVTLENLEVNLKFEFNQGNRGLYGGANAILDESPVK